MSAAMNDIAERKQMKKAINTAVAILIVTDIAEEKHDVHY